MLTGREIVGLPEGFFQGVEGKTLGSADVSFEDILLAVLAQVSPIQRPNPALELPISPDAVAAKGAFILNRSAPPQAPLQVFSPKVAQELEHLLDNTRQVLSRIGVGNISQLDKLGAKELVSKVVLPILEELNITDSELPDLEELRAVNSAKTPDTNSAASELSGLLAKLSGLLSLAVDRLDSQKEIKPQSISELRDRLEMALREVKVSHSEGDEIPRNGILDAGKAPSGDAEIAERPVFEARDTLVKESGAGRKANLTQATDGAKHLSTSDSTLAFRAESEIEIEIGLRRNSVSSEGSITESDINTRTRVSPKAIPETSERLWNNDAHVSKDVQRRAKPVEVSAPEGNISVKSGQERPVREVYVARTAEKAEGALTEQDKGDNPKVKPRFSEEATAEPYKVRSFARAERGDFAKANGPIPGSAAVRRTDFETVKVEVSEDREDFSPREQVVSSKGSYEDDAFLFSQQSKPKKSPREVLSPFGGIRDKELSRGREAKEGFAFHGWDTRGLGEVEGKEEVQPTRHTLPQEKPQDSKSVFVRLEDASVRMKFLNDKVIVDARFKGDTNAYVSFMDTKKLYESLKSLGFNLEVLRVNGVDVSNRTKGSVKREDRGREFLRNEEEILKEAAAHTDSSAGFSLLL